MSIIDRMPDEQDRISSILEKTVDGVKIEYVSVADISDVSPTKEETDQQLNDLDDYLAMLDAEYKQPPYFNHEAQTVEPHNVASKLFYEDHPDIQEWGLLMPSARALYYLTHVEETALPSGRLISEAMRRYLVDMYDSIGIRTRKKIAGDMVDNVLARTLDLSGSVQCLSLACGAADLMLERIGTFKRDNQYKDVRLTLVDIDDKSLDLAEKIGAEEGLMKGSDFVIFDEGAPENSNDRNLIRSMIASDRLVQRLGVESQQVVDAIGINEYFDTKRAIRFLKNSYAIVRPGGALITANMLADRPQKNINQLAVGWSDSVQPRSIDELIEMVTEAGLPVQHTSITIPEDGVYAVVKIEKPERAMTE